MKYWISAFLFSYPIDSPVVFSTKLLFYKILSLTLLASAFFLKKKKVKIVFFIFSGALWSLCHISPIPKFSTENLTRVVSTLSAFSNRKVIKKEHGEIGSSKLKYYIGSNTNALSTRLQNWVNALVLGEINNLDKDLIESFKRTGTIHLLVVSGLHFGIIYIFLSLMFEAPFRVLYVLLIINPKQWLYLKSFLHLATLILLFIYAQMIQFPFAVQRTLIFISIFSLNHLVLGKMPLMKKLLLIFFLQILLFPSNFVSSSAVLSWGTIILLLNIPRKASFLRKLSAIIYTQIMIGVLVLASLGNMSILGLFLNLLIIPIFPFIFIGALLLTQTKKLPTDIVQFISFIEDSFINTIHYLSSLTHQYSFLFVQLDSSLSYIQQLSIILATFCLVNTLRNLSIP